MTTPKPASAPQADALALALRFHETYERLAPSFGYETRTETRAFDPESPNGRLMIAVCGELAASAQVREGEPLPIEHPMSFESQAARVLGHGTAPKHVRRTLASYTPKPAAEPAPDACPKCGGSLTTWKCDCTPIWPGYVTSSAPPMAKSDVACAATFSSYAEPAPVAQGDVEGYALGMEARDMHAEAAILRQHGRRVLELQNVIFGKCCTIGTLTVANKNLEASLAAYRADAERLNAMQAEFEAHGNLTFRRYGPGNAGVELFTVTSQHVKALSLRDALDKALRQEAT